MSDLARHDAWNAADGYEIYMGRWSRRLAPLFLDWLNAAPDSDWLDIGCGTGALSEAILSKCAPRSLLGIDMSEVFVATCRDRLPDPRASFQTGSATQLALPDDSRDVVVAGLLINFVPEKEKVLAEMARVARPGGTVAFYVWDYPGGGMQFQKLFWQAATALDPAAEALASDRRFAFCTPEGLTALAENAGLEAVSCAPVEMPTLFADFDDYWRTFTHGKGPAPGYYTALEPDAQHRLRDKLYDSLPRDSTGSIPLMARAWAIRAVSPG